MIWSGEFRPLVQKRIIARFRKDYVTADKFREELKGFGMEISEEGKDKNGNTYAIWGPEGMWERESTWLKEEDIQLIEETKYVKKF